MRALFMRGAFTAADAQAAGLTLAAYSIGLLPFVLIRSVATTFLARGDTTTPVKALLLSVVVNVTLKLLLYKSYAQAGLAFATAVGAWVNFGALVWFAARAKLFAADERLLQSVWRLAVAGLALAGALLLCVSPLHRLFEGLRALRDPMTLTALAAVGAVVYGGVLMALFGRDWLALYRGRGR
jgi:putative peptidoglycan lipid II flippase